MGTIELSKRLLKASEYIVKNQPIADIGSDHAYLPIYLIQKELTNQAIAGEVVEGPYNNAKRKVAEYNLEDKIDVRFGSGLNVIQKGENIGTVFICGMGGVLISDILQEGLKQEKIALNTRLILQPNNAEDKLRIFLSENQFEIIYESILIENDKIYEIIVAESTTNNIQYSSEELLFGPLLIKEKSTVFKQKWEQELLINQQILNQLEQSENTERKENFTHKIHLIQKVIK